MHVGALLIQTRVSLISAGTERMRVEFGQTNLLGKVRARADLGRQVAGIKSAKNISIKDAVSKVPGGDYDPGGPCQRLHECG